MVKTRFYFIVILLLGIGFSKVQAQEVISSSGGEASSSEGGVSYSIGQVFYVSNDGSNGSIAEGAQQPYEISVINSLEDFNSILLNCSVYPNPTTDHLQLRIEYDQIEDLSYKLFDIAGTLIESKMVTNTETLIPMINLSASFYILKVFKNNSEVKTFKIIKN